MLRQPTHKIAAFALAVLALLPLLTLSAERSKIEFRLLRVDHSDPMRPLGVFAFRQTISRSLSVYGFNKPTNGHFHPRFIRYQVQTNVGWHRLPIYYCGTGAQTYPLRGGRTYTFTVAFPFTNATQEARIGISSERQATHWSDSFRLADSGRQ